jgi:hypothetical protein
MQISLLGKRWKLEFTPLGRARVSGEQVIGLCESPNQRGKRILIDSRLEDKQLLEVLIHEMLHAADWQKCESVVGAQAKDMTEVLWKLGYRKHTS